MEQISYLGQTLTRWRVGASTFLVCPEVGARLMNWNVTLGDGSVRDVIHWPELSSCDEFHKVRGGNPILFPFNARCFDGGDIHYWRDPAGVRRPMPMHGFARQGRFEVTKKNDFGFSAMLIPGEEAQEAYPFQYEFTVVYRFAPLGLTCELILKNLDTQPLPWSAGHHFYFTVPWEEGQTRADYEIRIPAERTYKQDARGGLMPGPELGEVEPLSNPDLVDTIHTGLKSSAVRFGPKGGEGGVTVVNGTEAKPQPEAAMVTWSLSPDAPYYCVEPWMGPPNAPEHKVGLHWVQPGRSQSFVVEVKLG